MKVNVNDNGKRREQHRQSAQQPGDRVTGKHRQDKPEKHE